MSWPSIREFLKIPKELTGKSVSIAVVDARFPKHPDIASNQRRNTYIVKTSEPNAEAVLLTADDGPWNKGLHGLSAASAAAGSGSMSDGYYTGAAPDANLYLIETGLFFTVEEIEMKFVAALKWLSDNWRQHHIRGVVLTVASTRDTGLLPWQADPIRILCEQLAYEGLLVVIASGNTKELTSSGPASSPSALSVGGVIVPESANVYQAGPYHGCRGKTFEGKWIPEILAPAENIVLPMPFRSPEEKQNHFTAPHDNLPEGYARTEGTSFAGPIILGCVACIWQAHPNWSADQVKAAIITNTFKIDELKELQAGLIDVAAAVSSLVTVDESVDKPFAIWKDWKTKDYLVRFERLESMKDQDKEGVEIEEEEDNIAALLSFCGDLIPDRMVDHLRSLLSHNVDKIRAAATTVLAFHSNRIAFDSLRRLLKDDSSYVRMAALFALNDRQDMWLSLTDDVIQLFSDSDLNIQYCAIELASKINNYCFVDPLISGLYDDARRGKVSIFGARCNALREITGISIKPESEWQEGECCYSDRTTQSRLYMAQEWEHWRSNHGER